MISPLAPPDALPYLWPILVWVGLMLVLAIGVKVALERYDRFRSGR